MRAFLREDLEINIFESYIIGARTFCIIKDGEALLIDAVLEDELVPYLKEKGVSDVLVLLTHGHYDHILGIPELQKAFSVRIGASERSRDILSDCRKNLSAFGTMINEMRRKKAPESSPRIVVPEYETSADYYFSDREVFAWKNHEIRFIFTPGHSDDSMCILMDDMYLFAGDSIADNGDPVLSLPGGKRNVYEEYSRPILDSLIKGRYVFPGHGDEFMIPLEGK